MEEAIIETIKILVVLGVTGVIFAGSLVLAAAGFIVVLAICAVAIIATLGPWILLAWFIWWLFKKVRSMESSIVNKD